MRRFLLALLGAVLCTANANAIQKTWAGGATGSWNTASNWSPSGVPSPTTGDTLIFDGSLAASVTITDVAAYTSSQSFGQLVVRNNITLDLSGLSNTFFYFSGGIQINTGSRVNVGAATATLFVIGGNTTTAGTTSIAGTLELKGNGVGFSTRCGYEPHTGFTANAVASVSGKIILSGTQAQISNSNSTNLVYTNGAILEITRNGGTVSPANYQSGSLVDIKGVTTSTTVITTGGIWNGEISWNCPGQTVTGGSAVILPSASASINSLRILNTGTGTCRLTTSPSGFSINTLTISGGTLELSAPTTAGRFGTINGDFIIGGGTVIGNATFAFDNIAPDSMQLIVNGSFIMNAGTFNLSNRPPALLNGGSFGMLVKGGFFQIAGNITASSSFAGLTPTRINYIQMQGTGPQALYTANWTGPVQLIADNPNGITLGADLNCPDTLYLKRGYIALQNYHVTTNGLKFKTQTVSPTPAFVTDGSGRVTYTNVSGGSTVVFPVSPMANSISSVILRNDDLVSPANSFSVRVERGNNPGGIFNTGQTINRTWIINDATNIVANSVALKFLYPDTVINSGPGDRSTSKELGHFVTPSWNIDPVSTTRIPASGGISPAIDTCGFFNPNSLDSAFVLGNQFSILSLQRGIAVNYFRGNKVGNSHQLHWAVNCASNQATFEVQRSHNGSSFVAIGNITASFSRCLLPFDFEDAAPLSGLNYYRIKITDINGAVTYSTMVLLQQKNVANTGIALQPTLVQQSYALLSITAVQKTTVQIAVTDVNGRQVQLAAAELSAGQNQVTLNLSQLRPGVYHITAKSAAEKWETVRFVKL